MAKFLEMEYVYNSEDPLVFHKVKMEIHVEEDGVVLKLYPDNMMTVEELEETLKGFQKDALNKRKIKLTTECKVEMYHGGNTYNVELSDGARIVKGIMQV